MEINNTCENKYADWTAINWREVDTYIFGLQVEIYKAAKEKRFKSVRNLQRIIINSYRGRLLAVKRVTQDNRGKRCPGVDGISFLTNKQRLKMVENLTIEGKSKPVRKVAIPKGNGNGKERILGVPTMEDRAKQMLINLALEPEWEAKFDPNSYGFRKGRSAQDAIKAVYQAVVKKDKFVLDADIRGCFDNIDHEALLEKLKCSERIRKQIKAWLKAGHVEWFGNYELIVKSDKGTPQGGVISPLLANIALNGMETYIKETLYQEGYRTYYMSSTRGKQPNSKNNCFESIAVIRYADDFVIIIEDGDWLNRAKELAEEWLEKLGLTLNKDKTRVCKVSEGFDFLGFNVRRLKRGIYRSDKNTKGERTGETILIQPPRENINRHYRDLADTINTMKSASIETLIGKLAPKIRGWCNYYQYVSASDAFHKLEYRVFNRLTRWAKRRHPNKGKKYSMAKYFMNHTKSEKWAFGTKRMTLKEHDHYKCNPSGYVKVQSNRSIYDGNLTYWSNRLKRYAGLSEQKMYLMRAQKGICPYCREEFTYEQTETLEVDHKIPTGIDRIKNDSFNNLQLLHGDCHDTKTKRDLELIKKERRTEKTKSKENIIIKESGILIINGDKWMETSEVNLDPPWMNKEKPTLLKSEESIKDYVLINTPFESNKTSGG